MIPVNSVDRKYKDRIFPGISVFLRQIVVLRGVYQEKLLAEAKLVTTLK